MSNSSMSSVRHAAALQCHAARAGFFWPDAGPVLDKLGEELAEVDEAVRQQHALAHIEEEIGDMLFVLVNLCRHVDADFDRALRGANAKFERRFRAMHALAKGRGQSLAELGDQDKLALWQQAKAGEQAIK